MPVERINSGLRLCPAEMNHFDSRAMRWKRVLNKTKNTQTVIGRKNFAMSTCDNQVFLTGGMDIARNLLSEFLVLNLWNGEWNELR